LQTELRAWTVKDALELYNVHGWGRDFFTMDDFALAGSTVLLRVDINSPIDPTTGRILNDARIREHLATVRDLRETKLAILAHQSRPGKDDFTTLEAHAERTSALLGRPVRYVDSLFGRHAVEAIQGMKPGDVVMLENTRFFAEEEALADARFEKMANAVMVRILAPLAHLGPVIGAVAFNYLKTFAVGYTTYWQFWLGAVLVVLVLSLPTGIVGTAGRLWARFRGGRG